MLGEHFRGLRGTGIAVRKNVHGSNFIQENNFPCFYVRWSGLNGVCIMSDGWVRRQFESSYYGG